MPFTDYEQKLEKTSGLATSPHDMDEALEILAANKVSWSRLAVEECMSFLQMLIDDFVFISDSWVKASLKGKRVQSSEAVGQEWLSGPFSILRNLKLLKNTLSDILHKGKPVLPGKLTVNSEGQVVAPVFPCNLYDRIMFGGTRAEVRMDPEVTLKNFDDHIARAYKKSPPGAGIALVLGGGNVSSIGPMDALYKLFVEKKVVILKMHPVNAYLGSLLEIGFRALIKHGYMKIVYGKAKEGAYLCNHDLVDEIHITGSNLTHDAIVFGSDAVMRKSAKAPVLDKPISSELGNVSPVIIVPGEWTDEDLVFQAENLVSSLVNNAGFNCNATRVLITSSQWPQREAFLQAIRDRLTLTECRPAYYPGAKDNYDLFQWEHPEGEEFGDRTERDLPWMFIPNLDSNRDEDICFRKEPFCSVFGETSLNSASAPTFLQEAVAFCNNKLWGTLNATILINPSAEESSETRDALEKAISQLRYGTVSVNHWAAMGYAMCSTTWGAFPGHDIYDIQSGMGVVHNTYMFAKPQKSVIRGPFRPWPKPAWFISNRKGHVIGRQISNFQGNPSIFKLPGLIVSGLMG